MRGIQAQRRGFTVIELLVVISIIVVLAALGAGAYFRLSANSRQRFTEDTITRLASQLQTQMAAVADRANNEPIPPAVLSAAGNDPVRARAIYVKMRLKQEFPQSFAEARSGVAGFLPPLSGYTKAIEGKDGTPEQQSAVLLMLSLNRTRSGMAAFDATQHVSAAAMRDIPIGGGIMKVFVDAFGAPIVFTRWPGAWSASAGMGNASLTNEMKTISRQSPDKRDPSDPEGRLNGFNLGALAGPLAPYQPPVGGDACNLSPVIWSAGPNREYGVLVGDLTTVDQRAANDNIYSFRLRKDGQRGD